MYESSLRGLIGKALQLIRNKKFIRRFLFCVLPGQIYYGYGRSNNGAVTLDRIHAVSVASYYVICCRT
jgi:hypothetical protein